MRKINTYSHHSLVSYFDFRASTTLNLAVLELWGCWGRPVSCDLRAFTVRSLSECFGFHHLPIHSFDSCCSLHWVRKPHCYMLALMAQLAQERWINSKTADRKCALGLRASRLLHCVYLCDMLLSPPPLFLTQACSKPGPVPDCIWLVIISSQLGSSGAPAALMKQNRLSSLHLTSTHPPPASLPISEQI